MNHPVAIGMTGLRHAPARTETSKVLHLINGEHYSGAERVQDLLGMGLAASGYEVDFACLKPDLFPRERRSTNPCLDLNMRSRVDFKAILKLRKLVKQQGYDILHAHTPRTLMVGSLVRRSTGCPLIYHVHSPVGRDSLRTVANRVNKVVESWASRQVDHFVCVSESIRDYMIQQGIATDRLTTVANGVAVVDEVPPRPTPRGCWTLGTTALFRPRKGTEVLLQALALLRSSGHDVRLLAVGPFETNEYQQKIRALTSELQLDDLIEWTGFVNDVDSYFRRMDAFVLPSLFGEGLPMVVLEAMAIGTPVIAAEVEGVNQAIRGGRDGLIFEPGNAAQLAARVEDFIEERSDWQGVRASALRRQRQHFSDSSMAAGVAAVYRQVATRETSVPEIDVTTQGLRVPDPPGQKSGRTASTDYPVLDVPESGSHLAVPCVPLPFQEPGEHHPAASG